MRRRAKHPDTGKWETLPIERFPTIVPRFPEAVKPPWPRGRISIIRLKKMRRKGKLAGRIMNPGDGLGRNWLRGEVL